jgi:hypothetical protein
MTGITWEGGVTPEQMVQKLTDLYVAAIRAGLLEIAQRRAPEITQWMQANRPWTDRTHQARSTLETTPEQVEADLVQLLLTHGVEHGWYLEGINPATMMEMMNAGRWAILVPAVDVWGPVIMQDIRRLVGG